MSVRIPRELSGESIFYEIEEGVDDFFRFFKGVEEKIAYLRGRFEEREDTTIDIVSSDCDFGAFGLAKDLEEPRYGDFLGLDKVFEDISRAYAWQLVDISDKDKAGL